jgi:hypothetical protein
MVVFVEEDVAAREIWRATKDGQTDGFEFLPNNVLVSVLWFLEAPCFESAV